MSFRHPGGALSQMRASLTATGANGLEILGDAGALAFDGPVFRPWGLRLRPITPRGAEGRGRLGALRDHPAAQRLQQVLAPLRGPRWSRRRHPYAGNGYGHEAAEVMACIRAGEQESLLMPLDSSVAIAALIDRLLAESAA